jgi:hypothetical protein
MVYRIWTAVEPFVLRAELFDRESIEETKTFLEAVLRENRRYRRPCLLIHVSSSRPVFHVEQHGLIDCFRDLVQSCVTQIALLGDTEELRLSHEYLELIAQQHGLDVRSFADEETALGWFRYQRSQSERRETDERRRHRHWLRYMERRRGERRYVQRRAAAEHRV